IQTGLYGQLLNNLGSASKDDQFVTDSFFHRGVTELLQILIMNVVMTDDGTSQDGLRIGLDGRIHQFFHWNGRSTINALNTIFFDTTMLDIDDFPKSHGVFIIS